ncbi:hypothetical protein GXB85_15365 [Cellulomonas sp. APG4]|uniref:hypothetical protein n=1 Tax=Cellulomonas sp. APG4 TaxID=1538656 RepID=UPI001379669A|nr:hypothetical protein [Cellulomonas sp. APG4]NCT92319.1 hypothetical protein [Cellulomonas sp. APG4]
MLRTARGPRSRPRARSATAALLVTVALAVTGCTGSPGDTQDGFGLPTSSPTMLAELPGATRPVEGTLRVATNGCFLWSDDGGAERWVLWPPDARHDGDHVRLADGTRVGEGAELRGTGIAVDAADLPTWQEEDGYLHSFGTYCAADESGVLVLDEVSPVS